MKKLLSTFALALLATISTWAQTTFTVDNLKYTVTDETANTVELTGYESEPTGALTIPATVNYNSTTYSVTSIRDYAFQYCRSLTQVTISDGVTSIGDYAFQFCSALRQITIPDGVTSIGDYTFSECSALRQMNIPNSVTSIGDDAFYRCSALTQVTIGNGVTSIGNWAFANCKALTQVTIGDDVESIGNYAFSDCSALAEITVLPTVPPTITASTFSDINLQVKVSVPEGSRDAYMADENWKQLLGLSEGQANGTCGDNLTWTFTTADSTLTISGTGDMYSFSYQPWGNFRQGIKNISIQDGVTSIGEGAFAGCSKPTQVTIPDGVTSIGDSAFEGCSALTAVYYTGDVAGWCGITFTGYTSNPLLYAHNLYINNNLVTELVIPEGVTEIKSYAFYNCSALTQVTIGNSVTSIGNWAFAYCSALTQVTIGSSVESIGNSAFYNCSALTQVTIPDSVTSIGSSAFEGCSALTQVTIPGSVTSIGSSAFRGCYALAQVTIGSGVKSIGNYAFDYCSALAEITVLATVPPTITANTFRNISTQVKVSIPEGSRDAYMADENWKQLLDLSAGELSGICGDNLTWTFTTADSTLTISGTGNMYDYYSSNQPWYNFRQGIKNISIQDGVESIGNYAFYPCSSLTKVTIGNSVESIGSSAFAHCSALRQVTIGDGVESIGERAFEGCSALAQVTIGSGVTSIGYSAFSSCSALAEMTVKANTPPTLGVNVFNGVSRSIPVYVPAEALEDYQAAAVWKEFNLHAMPTALQTPSMPESIRVYGGQLHNPQGLPVSIYDMQGRMVYSGTAATVSQPAGVYVLRCAGASSKVLF